MTHKWKTLLVVGFMMVSSANLLAAHEEGGDASVSSLRQESNELDQMVRYSPLNWNVKRAVSEFDRRVDQLADCALSNPFGNWGGRDHDGGFRDHGSDIGVPFRCRDELREARFEFSNVRRYLYDTQYDYPRIYRQFRETEQVLNSLSVGNDTSGPGYLVQCTAVDNGWEEHYGGHTAFGRNIREAQFNALNQCQRVHGSCRIQSCR